MDTLVRAGLSNAIAAGLLALVAAGAGRLWSRRPALVHGLWLLVLLKLLTPPLIEIPIYWNLESAPAPDVAAVRSLPIAEEAVEATSVAEDHPDEFAWLNDVELADAPAAEEEPAVVSLVPQPAPSTFNWLQAVEAVWITGSLCWFSLAALRLARFGRLLRHASPADAALQAEADSLAAELGMNWSPRVALLPGRLAPMVWSAIGKPRLFLPRDLLAELDATQREALLVHELAHLRRGDHRVRWIELLALGIYWWHPAAWRACSALREAEEQCCDAWVVALLPDASRAYATALVQTLDFLSAAPAAPPLACGIERVSNLKRRLTMIMRGVTPRALGWREGMAVLLLAAVLPLVPVWAHAEPDELPSEQLNDLAVALDLAFVADENSGQADAEKAKAELAKLEADLQKKLAEVREASKKLKAVAEKLSKTKAVDRALMLSRNVVVAEDKKAKVQKGQTFVIEVEVTDDGQTKVRRLDKTKGRVDPTTPRGAVFPNPVPSPESKAQPTFTFGLLKPEAPAAAPLVPPAPVALPTPPAGNAPPAVAPPLAAPRELPRVPDVRIETAPDARAAQRAQASADRRMDKLEKKLDAVLKELEAMRKEKKSAPMIPSGN